MIPFGDFVPLSQIVHEHGHGHGHERNNNNNNNTDNNLQNIINVKKIAYNLYIKYIANSSEYEINIEYDLRARFTNLMSDYHQWIGRQSRQRSHRNRKQSSSSCLNININVYELLDIYNEVILEMYRLMSFSLSRFKHSLQRNKR